MESTRIGELSSDLKPIIHQSDDSDYVKHVAQSPLEQKVRSPTVQMSEFKMQLAELMSKADLKQPKPTPKFSYTAASDKNDKE